MGANVAALLYRSRKTIDAHKTRLMPKLDSHDRVELTRWALRRDLVEL